MADWDKQRINDKVLGITGMDQTLNSGSFFSPMPGVMLINQGGMGVGADLGMNYGDLFFDFAGNIIGESSDATINPVAWGIEAADFLVGKVGDYLAYNEQQYAEGTNGARSDNLIYETINAVFGIGGENVYRYGDTREFLSNAVISPAFAASDWYSDKFEKIYSNANISENPAIQSRVDAGELYRNSGDFYDPMYPEHTLMINEDRVSYYNYVDRYGDVAVSGAAAPIAVYAITTGSIIAAAGGIILGVNSVIKGALDKDAYGTGLSLSGLIFDLCAKSYIGAVLNAVYNTITLDSDLPNPYGSEVQDE